MGIRGHRESLGTSIAILGADLGSQPPSRRPHNSIRISLGLPGPPVPPITTAGYSRAHSSPPAAASTQPGVGIRAPPALLSPTGTERGGNFGLTAPPRPIWGPAVPRSRAGERRGVTAPLRAAGDRGSHRPSRDPHSPTRGGVGLGPPPPIPPPPPSARAAPRSPRLVCSRTDIPPRTRRGSSG